MAKKTPEINATSTADIAFLLLVFFLATTSMNVDSGIFRRLPPYTDSQEAPKINKRNILKVMITRNNELGINDNPADMRDSDMATMAIGQSIAVTPLQLVTAVSAIANDVAERRAVGGFHSACPVIGGVVFEIGRYPVERGEFVEGHIPREVGGLAIVERSAEVAEGVHDGVFPRGVFGGVEFLVHHHIGLLDFGIGAGHEAEVDILRGIPPELQGTIPEEVAGEAERERTVVELFDVALLQFVVVARKVGHQRDVLRQRVDAEIAQYA